MSRQTPSAGAPEHVFNPLVRVLRCLDCRDQIEVKAVDPAQPDDLGPNGRLRCRGCGNEYPIVAGTPRMLAKELHAASAHVSEPMANSVIEISANQEDEIAVKRRTAASFTYEWEHFGRLREEWRKNFLDYMKPHKAEWFAGRFVLDVGSGSGRHSYQAARLGARVVAVDIGGSIDVARRNLPDAVLTVQADAERLPFEPGTFDLVMAIGVLHHLPHPERAFRSIVRLVAPGGYLKIYVYWIPPRKMHARMLMLVSIMRRVTTRMPYSLLHLFCYPLAVGLFATFVLPYRLLRRVPSASAIADVLPLKTYADYPFRVCVNDQFDRFSAPIEHRYTASEIERWLRSAGLEAIEVIPHHGWLATGRVPVNG